MKFKLIAALFFVFGTIAPVSAQTPSSCPQNWITGYSSTSPIRETVELCHTKIAIAYDRGCRIPAVVSERLTEMDLYGPWGRESTFQPDPLLNPEDSATNRDYLREGYDKGHLSPAADNAGSKDTMKESFYLSNTAPQIPNNNRGIWKKLEDRVRKEAISDGEGDRFILTGTITNGERRMNGRICIPSHFYKIVHYPKSNITKSWIIPNENIADMNLDRYETTHTEIEKLTGFKFFESPS